MLPGGPLEQPGQPPGRPHAIHRQRPHGVQRRGHPDRPSEFARSAIRVDHRFTYEQAMAVMKDPGGEHPGVAPEVAAMLGRMLELAMILRRRRFARGALELNMPEVEIDLGEQGEVIGAHLAVHDESHQVIEEFMLAANEAVAAAPDRAGDRLPPPGPPRPRAVQARRVRRVRPQPGPRDRPAAEPVRAPAHPRRDGRQARGIRRPLRAAAQPEAGQLHARARGALRPGQRGLLPLHLADPPLPRPPGPPPAHRLARRQEAEEATTTSWPSWPSTAPAPSAGPRPPSAS